MGNQAQPNTALLLTLAAACACASFSALAAAPKIGGCQVFPANNAWNVAIDRLPADPNSDAYVGTMQGSTKKLHADWGNVPADFYGIPFVLVPGSQPKLNVTFGDEAADESDAGPYPIPPNPPIEGGPSSTGDRHILMIDTDNCILYELYSAYPPSSSANWDAYSGAIYDLKSNALRPDTWTSADAAGLPIFPGLVRWEEVAAGEINHAIRMTADLTRNTYVWPARHHAGSAGASRPPMGQRFRLKAGFDISGFRAETQVVLRALKKYGAIIADNGSNWFITGTTDTRWPDQVISQLNSIQGSNFEAVDGASLRISANSGAAKVAAREDWNLDGKPDLLWSNTANGATYAWYMNGPALLSDALIASVDPSWKVQGVADFNGDGKPDIVWRNTANGNTYVWYMNGTALISDAFLFGLPPEWVIQGVADFNADGKPDFLMRNTVSGNAFAWFFNNAAAIGDQFLFNIDPAWKVEAVADINLDGQPDLLFRNTGSGLAFAWYTQYGAGSLSLAGSSASIFSIDPAWEVVQMSDWNGDGKPDLVFRNTGTGLVFVWYMDGTTLTTSSFITQIDSSWEVVPRR